MLKQGILLWFLLNFSCVNAQGYDGREPSQGLYAALATTAVIFVAVILGICVFFCRKKKQDRKNSLISHETTPSVDIPLQPITAINSIHSMKGRVKGTAVPDLRSMVLHKQQHNAKMLSEEFKQLPSGPTSEWIVGAKQSNKNKNRFKSVYPYDHTRVVLEETGEPDSDYINASYIDGVDKKRRYIAAQGPKSNTIDDFWRMIWQLKSTKIVMVTNLKEAGKSKCEKYWPDIGNRMSTQNFELRVNKETINYFYTMRMITVKSVQSEEERKISQFHFTLWPDHGVPDTMDLVLFHQRIRNFPDSSNGPLIVHCSAGIGRTGTFIGLDSLYEFGKKNGAVDILPFVKIMRKCRIAMVQTEEQYQVMHTALVEAFELPDTKITAAALNTEVDRRLQTDSKNQELLKKEFQALLYTRTRKDKLKPVQDDIQQRKGSCADRYAIYSRSYIPGMPDELEAVYIQSWKSPRGFIVSKCPTKSSVGDFWHIVMDHDSTILVYIGNSKAKTDIWLPVGSKLDIDNIAVRPMEPPSQTGDIVVSNYNITDKVCETNLIVKVFQHINWPADREPSCEDVYQLFEMIDNERQLHHSVTVMVTCSDGMSQSGLFCLINNTRSQLRMDGEVDIFQAARRLQSRRQDFVNRYEQYKFGYNFMKFDFAKSSA